jgi:hypothetical protein
MGKHNHLAIATFDGGESSAVRVFDINNFDDPLMIMGYNH